jgi:hypothetical protein
MSVVRKSLDWMFAPQAPAVAWWRVILWWEARRIPYNLLVGLYGALCLVIFFWSITTSGHLKPGEDAVEPRALFAAPFGVNVCYTLGWLVEVPARALSPSLSPRLSPLLLKLGISLSIFLISIPAVFWGGYRLLQLAHVLH